MVKVLILFPGGNIGKNNLRDTVVRDEI